MGDILRATFRNIYIYTTVCNDDGFSLKLRIYPHRDLGKTLTVLKLTERLPQTLRNETLWANGNRLVAVTVTKNAASSQQPQLLKLEYYTPQESGAILCNKHSWLKSEDLKSALLFCFNISLTIVSSFH